MGKGEENRGVPCIKDVFNEEDAMKEGGESDVKGVPDANVNSCVGVVDIEMASAKEDAGIDAENDDVA